MDKPAADRIRKEIVALLPRLRAFGRSLARSQDAADDLVQATCERALRNLDQWTPGTRLDSWMFRIMHNHWIDEKRRPNLVLAVDNDAMPDAAGEDGRQVTEARLVLGAAGAAIEALPEEQRTVLVLTCVEELSYRETAEILEIPIGTVMSRLARARAAVTEALGGEAEGGARRGGRR